MAMESTEVTSPGIEGARLGGDGEGEEPASLAVQGGSP